MNVVEKIALALGKGVGELRLDDVQRNIPELRRTAERYEKKALSAEKASLEARAKAFSPDTLASERAILMRKAADEAARARRLEGQTTTFLAQLENFTSLETTMKIVEEMTGVGLFEKGTKAVDWQRALDDMQIEIKRLTEMGKRWNDAMSSAMAQSTTSLATPEVSELERLFKQWETEPDPAKKAEIQKQIDRKTNVTVV